MYTTPIPASVEIYVGEFRKAVKFEILQPDNLLGLISPGLTVSDIIQASKIKLTGGQESSGITSNNIIVNLALYIVFLAILAVFALSVYILKHFKKFRKKFKPMY